MGISLACPFSILGDVESDFESILVKSISFGNGTKTPVRSVSFNDRDSEPMTMKSLGSGKMTKETSVSLRESELEKMTLAKCFSPENKRMDLDDLVGTIRKSPVLDPTNPKHRAALQLQKVYKSFRTRRKLADCAVLAEQGWWKLLDFAELKRSSISFFDIEKHETAISRWSRARTRAAKVGKGLSKNDKAQKLALQHWLEAIDPRHRYGHNLHFYYIKWLHCESREPFFYWLDVGEGKEVNLVEKCSRFKLQQQCIKYLGPMERLDYEVVVEDGKFVYKKSKEFLHTPEEAKDCKWIFVLSTSKTLYVGKKRKGTFQHSSFLAGGATSAAGRLVVKNGILKAVWPHSGHYRPTEENFKDFISFLEEQIVDLSDVKLSSLDDGDELLYKQKSSSPQRRSSSEGLIGKSSGSEGIHTEEIRPKISDTTGKEKEATMQPSNSKRLHILTRGLSNLEIPSRVEQIERLERGNQEVEVIPEESILKRINSHKGMMSFQLGRQLSCKWTTGAGPRIGCVRDYPPELQLRALQQVSLSPSSVALPPRSVGLPRALFSSKRRHEHHTH